MNQANEFLAKMKDKEFAKELEQEYLTATIRFAAQHGYSFTEEDYAKAISENDPTTEEMTEDELERTAGGIANWQANKYKVTTMAVGEEGGGAFLNML